jgi:hypothetical protein
MEQAAGAAHRQGRGRESREQGERDAVVAARGFGDALAACRNKEGADLLLEHGANPKLGKPCQAQNKPPRAEIQSFVMVIGIEIAGFAESGCRKWKGRRQEWTGIHA